MGDSKYSMSNWHKGLQNLRKYLRGWNLREIGGQRELKDKLGMRLGELDCFAEQRLLTNQEWEERMEIDYKLEEIAIAEDSLWKQRAGTKWILQGDTNSHFYHNFANGRRKTQYLS